MSGQPTSKEVQQRIARDYFRKPDRLQRWKRFWSVWVALVAAGYAGWALTDQKRGVEQFSHGPLSHSHALWENRCEVCHDPFVPVKAEAITFAEWVGLYSPATETWGSVSDQKCQACHQPGGHHPDKELLGDVGNCTSCHHEHHGRTSSLVQLTDRQCVSCHGELEKHRTGQGDCPKYVTRFTAHDPEHRQHPDFRSLKRTTDLGAIHFSHARHMSLGLQQKDREKLFRWDDYPELIGGKLRGENPRDPIQLNCADCHQPGIGLGDSGSSAKGGAHMAPIQYEQHCRACHPLELKTAQPAVSIAHGQRPDQLENLLVTRFWKEQLTTTDLKNATLPVRPLPGQSKIPELEKASTALQASLSRKRVALMTECVKCHQLSSPLTGELIPALTPSRIPNTWLKHARFDHTAHRGVACLECHPGGTTSTQSRELLFTGKESCARCHHGSDVPSSLIGASNACTECHSYHQHSLVGGNPSASRRTIDAFLTGKAPESVPAQNTSGGP